MAYNLNPNATNNELLWLGDKHRAYHVFTKAIDADFVFKPKRGDQSLFKLIKERSIPEDVMQVLVVEGFGGVIQAGFTKLDRGLVTALVEKWRPETHTFHFQFGEATITLQDVQVIWGLPVDGRVVTGNNDILSRENYGVYINSLLGFTPPLENLYIKTTYLREELIKPVRDPVQRARVYMLHLISAVLFPDSSGNKVNICWLDNLRHVGTNIKYSWGSAVLAHLYRNLCKGASSAGDKIISGPLTFLQFWAWERIIPVQPRMRNNTPSIHGNVLAFRWSDERSFGNSPRHSVSSFRQTLSTLTNEQFVWTPYDDKIGILSERCRSGMGSWRCDTFLVCWQYVDPHLPSRVLRQFSMYQPIPTNVGCSREVHEKLHKDSKAGRNPEKNWERKYANYIQEFERRLENVVQGQPLNNERPSQEYTGWFYDRTTSYVEPPSRPTNNQGFSNFGPNMQLMYEGLSQLQHFLGELGEIATRYINESHASDWFPQMQPHLVQGYQAHAPNVQRAPRMPRQARRRNDGENEAGPSNVHAAGPSNVHGSPNQFDLNDGVWQTQESLPVNFSYEGQAGTQYTDLGLSLGNDFSGTQSSQLPPFGSCYTPVLDSNAFNLMSTSNDFIRTHEGREHGFANTPTRTNFNESLGDFSGSASYFGIGGQTSGQGAQEWPIDDIWAASDRANMGNPPPYE